MRYSVRSLRRTEMPCNTHHTDNSRILHTRWMPSSSLGRPMRFALINDTTVIQLIQGCRRADICCI